MNRSDRLTGSVGAQFHSVSHYTSPADVLDDAASSPAEKRVILSSWASDMYAVDSCPGLRQIPGIAEPMYLKDILAALRKLDKADDRPRGDDAVVDTLAQARISAGSTRPRIAIPKSRWSRDANVRRYRRLLDTQLTDHERRYVEQRLADELGEVSSVVEPPKAAMNGFPEQTPPNDMSSYLPSRAAIFSRRDRRTGREFCQRDLVRGQ